MKTWAMFWRLIRFSPGRYLATLLLQLPRYVLILAPGLVVREIFDHLSVDNSFILAWDNLLWFLLALLVMIPIIRGGLVLSAIFVEVTTSLYSATLLRSNLFTHLLDLPDTQALPYPAGNMANRLDEDPRLISQFLRYSLVTVGAGLGALAAVAIMLSISPLITAVVLVPLIAVSVAINLAGTRLEKLRRTKRTADSDISAFLAEVFGAVQAVQVHTAEPYVIERFHRLNQSRRQAALSENIFQDVMLNSVFENVKYLSIGIILLLAGRSMQAGDFSVGDFALFVSTLIPVADFTVLLGRNLAFYQQVKVSWMRLQEVTRDPSSEALVEKRPVYLRGTYPQPTQPARTATDRLYQLELSGLTYCYPDSGRGIQDISLTLSHGSFTVITGRIGSGKTTLLRVLLGLAPKTVGEIRWNGQVITDPAAFFVPPRSAYTPQVPRLFSQTLQENILLGRSEQESDLATAIQQAVIEHDIEELPEGLHTPVGPKGIKLSGGQIQRAAAARMFVRRPELLVFDDLSSALDVDTEQLLWERLFDDEAERVTCLVVSHRRAALRRADHILVLKDGKIEDEGRLDKLLDRCEEMQRLWRGEVGQVSCSDNN